MLNWAGQWYPQYFAMPGGKAADYMGHGPNSTGWYGLYGLKPFVEGTNPYESMTQMPLYRPECPGQGGGISDIEWHSQNCREVVATEGGGHPDTTPNNCCGAHGRRQYVCVCTPDKTGRKINEGPGAGYGCSDNHPSGHGHWTGIELPPPTEEEQEEEMDSSEWCCYDSQEAYENGEQPNCLCEPDPYQEHIHYCAEGGCFCGVSGFNSELHDCDVCRRYCENQGTTGG